MKRKKELEIRDLFVIFFQGLTLICSVIFFNLKELEVLILRDFIWFGIIIVKIRSSPEVSLL